MPRAHQCICQHENPNSPYPAGSDGCTPNRRSVLVAQPSITALPLGGLLAAVQLDADNEQVRPQSLATLLAQDVLAIETGLPIVESLLSTTVKSRLPRIMIQEV